MDSAGTRIGAPADLHLHSTHSDGTETPAEVMRSAHDHGMRTAALTDHDTTTGWAEAAAAAAALGMGFVPGMELSARHAWRSVHVLAYLFDPDDAAVRALTTRIRSSRQTRAREMADRLARDFDLTWDDVLARTAPGATVGRPHLADALVARGIVADRGAAFADLLRPDSDYYVALWAPDPIDAVRAVVAAGGVAVVAHPAGRGMLPVDVLEQMIAAGLAGFETGHRENREPELTRIRELVRRHDLIETGSSDSHGAGKDNVPGEFTTAQAPLTRLTERARGA